MISHGDVVAFTEGVRPGIIIADTCGHRLERGQAYQKFLEEQITDGWGKRQISDEMHDLERRIRAKIKAEGSTKEADETYGWTALGFAQFEERIISYSGTGLDFPLIIRKDGSIEEIRLMLPKFEREESLFRTRPAYDQFSLGENEVFLLKSDGLIDNIGRYFDARVREYANKQGLKHDETFRDHLPPELGKALDRNYVKSRLVDTIRKHQAKPAADLREEIIAELGEYFFPATERHDDVTFAVVKQRV